MINSDLDRFDQSIIEALQDNARMTLAELSDRVGLSKTPCQIRMRRLEKDGYILGYKAIVDHRRLGNRHIAFVQVTLSDTKTRALQSFNKAVSLVSAVTQCHMIAGGFDYLLKIRTTDMDEYRKVLGEQISSLPYVVQTSTFVVMEAVKD
ncbi:MAG: Lrp/AsnC family leucine-responsive transcriptional regulator [Gammaproteobacteria bacterium]|jgi:Lrp/AsnC family leucine-responsive transcriptional regulator